MLDAMIRAALQEYAAQCSFPEQIERNFFAATKKRKGGL